jgi:hypothetical protein
MRAVTMSHLRVVVVSSPHNGRDRQGGDSGWTLPDGPLALGLVAERIVRLKLDSIQEKPEK